MKEHTVTSVEHGARSGDLAPGFSAPVGISLLCSRYSPPVTRHSTRRAGGAFTLIELLVVVAVIAILAGITLAALGGINQKGARDRTRAEIAGIVNALERYKSQNDVYPAANGSNLPYAVISAFMPQVNPDGNLTNLTDPYGNNYLYRFPGTQNMATFDVWSPGVDANASATNDDIGNW